MATTTITTNDKNQWQEKELGCFWKRVSQGSGQKYLTGVLKAEKLIKILNENPGEDIQLICFVNKQKNLETHPDLRVYLSEKKPAASKPKTVNVVKTTTQPKPAVAQNKTTNATNKVAQVVKKPVIQPVEEQPEQNDSEESEVQVDTSDLI